MSPIFELAFTLMVFILRSVNFAKRCEIFILGLPFVGLHSRVLCGLGLRIWVENTGVEEPCVGKR
jgi:hypothetical protein